MINAIDAINFAAAISGLIIAVMGLFFTLSLTYLNQTLRKFFIILFSLITVYVASDFLSQISLVFLGPGYALLSKIALFFESLFSSMLMPVLTMILLYCSGERRKRTPLFACIVTLWFVYVFLLVLTQFTTIIYTITPDNVYQRGPWYPVLLLPPILLMIVNLYVYLRNRRELSLRRRKAFACYLLIPLLCMLIQSMAYGLLMIVIGTSAAGMLMFIFILQDQIDRYVRQQEENARQRSDIMLLQMRPHFIYNTLTSIYYLCRQDVDRAQQVILDFTSYLRKNFTAVAKEGMIPFAEEMEHTRAYLAVEQVRFEDKLFIEFDTPHTAFHLPPLTLQPVVENAVKHGIDPEMEPLRITVRTRQTDRGSEIVVEDTGPGFKPADDNEPHTALANIRKRLELTCGGSMSVCSGPEGGTSVTIVIPPDPAKP